MFKVKLYDNQYWGRVMGESKDKKSMEEFFDEIVYMYRGLAHYNQVTLEYVDAKKGIQREIKIQYI